MPLWTNGSCPRPTPPVLPTFPSSSTLHRGPMYFILMPLSLRWMGQLPPVTVWTTQRHRPVQVFLFGACLRELTTTS